MFNKGISSSNRFCSSSSSAINNLKTSLAAIHQQLEAVQKQLESFEKEQQSRQEALDDNQAALLLLQTQQQKEALEFVKSIDPGNCSEQTCELAKMLLNKTNENPSAFCTKKVVDHLLLLMEGFGRENFDELRNGKFVNVTTSLLKIFEANPNFFVEYVLNNENSTALLKGVESDETSHQNVSFNALRCTLLIMKYSFSSSDASKLFEHHFLGTFCWPRLFNCIIYFYKYCEVAESIQTLSEMLLEIFENNSENENTKELLSSLEKNKWSVSAFHSAISVCGYKNKQHDSCAVLKLARLVCGEDKIKSFPQLQKRGS